MKLLPLLLIITMAYFGCKENKQPKDEPLLSEASSAKVMKTETEKKPKVETTAKTTQDNQDDWYWKNTIKSNEGTFENWNQGHADIMLIFRVKQGENSPSSQKIGRIDANGTITINLPDAFTTETTLDNINNLIFYDIQDLKSLHYENGKAGYISKTNLTVEQGGNTIGTLTLGNSVRVTYNLTNQSTLTMGDEGYIIYWAYVDEAGSVTGTETRTATARRSGTNTIEAETTVTYNLQFKPGWNLIKTEVIGTFPLQHERGLNASWFKEHKHTVVKEVPEDAAYFFRKL